MDLQQMLDSDKALVGQVLRAAAEGPFFPDWEFHSLFGLTRKEVRSVADAWPNVDLENADVALAINNALNNLLGYPHGEDAVWSQWISVDHTQLDKLLGRLRNATGEGYFDRLM
jgi:hypothetical protein